MTTPVGIPNYQQLKKTRAGLETVRGTKVAPTNPWYGVLAVQRHQPLADSEEYAGTWFQDYTPVRGAVMVDGTYSQQLSYDDAHLFRYCVKGGVTGTDDTNTTHGYTYAFRHTAAQDDFDTCSLEYGHPGMVFESQGVMFPEFTISGDIDDAQANWKFNSRLIGISKDLKAGLDDVAATGGTTTTFVKTGWGQTISALVGGWAHFKTGTAGNIGLFRQITANDATSITFAALPSSVASSDTIDVYPPFTAGISDRTRDMIKAPGTELYLDTGTIGTTKVTGRFISFSITGVSNIGYKRFMENVTTMSTRVDRGRVRVSGQVRLEFDRKREWVNYVNLQPEKLRIAQPNGPVIDSGAGTKKAAYIDVFQAVWDDPTEDTRGNNSTITWPFWGYVDSSEAVPLEIRIKNRQSSLLA